MNPAVESVPAPEHAVGAVGSARFCCFSAFTGLFLWSAIGLVCVLLSYPPWEVIAISLPKEDWKAIVVLLSVKAANSFSSILQVYVGGPMFSATLLALWKLRRGGDLNTVIGYGPFAGSVGSYIKYAIIFASYVGKSLIWLRIIISSLVGVFSFAMLCGTTVDVHPVPPPFVTEILGYHEGKHLSPGEIGFILFCWLIVFLLQLVWSRVELSFLRSFAKALDDIQQSHSVRAVGEV